MAERPGSGRSILGIFDCWSAGLYRLVSRSWLGRCSTGYRREPTALLSGETRARGMHAMSDRRCRVVRAAEGGRVRLSHADWFTCLPTVLRDCTGCFSCCMGLYAVRSACCSRSR